MRQTSLNFLLPWLNNLWLYSIPNLQVYLVVCVNCLLCMYAYTSIYLRNKGSLTGAPLLSKFLHLVTVLEWQANATFVTPILYDVSGTQM